MKKAFILLALALVSVFASAQTDSVEVYRFTYEFCDSNVYAKRNYPDRMRLEIQKNGASEFYSEYGQAQAASAANVIGMTQDEVMAYIKKSRLAKTGVDYRILKHFPERGKMTVTDKQAMSEFYYIEEIPQPEWMLSDGEKEICGYQCKKGEADFLGRHWTTWYAEELPMNNGPWKLGGLPGLILEANDANDFFHFTCIGIETVNALPIRKIDKKFVKCSRKDINRMEREFFNDRMGFMDRMMESKGGRDGYIKISRNKNGKETKFLPKEDHIFIEKEEGDEK